MHTYEKACIFFIFSLILNKTQFFNLFQIHLNYFILRFSPPYKINLHILRSVWTVSYTHLDVYKRQGHGSTREVLTIQPGVATH